MLNIYIGSCIGRFSIQVVKTSQSRLGEGGFAQIDLSKTVEFLHGYVNKTSHITASIEKSFVLTNFSF